MHVGFASLVSGQVSFFLFSFLLCKWSARWTCWCLYVSRRLFVLCKVRSPPHAQLTATVMPMFVQLGTEKTLRRDRARGSSGEPRTQPTQPCGTWMHQPRRSRACNRAARRMTSSNADKTTERCFVAWQRLMETIPGKTESGMERRQPPNRKVCVCVCVCKSVCKLAQG